jgi:hypothetical protein
MPWGVIDDEAIEEARSVIGVPLRRDNWAWVEQASRDTISHYAEGMGDGNPLWTDRQYGPTSCWGANLAPPAFLYSVDGNTVAPKLPGVQWIYASCDWVWDDVLRLGDEFYVEAHLLHVKKMQATRFADLWAMQTGQVDYFRRGSDGSAGQRVGRATTQIARTPRKDELDKATGGNRKYGQRPTHRYTQDELLAIEKEALAEPVRGAETRYWEDVQVGDEIDQVVKGPLTSTDIIGYYAAIHGARPYGGTHELVYKYRQRHDDFHINEDTGAKDSAGRGHLEQRTGVDVGMGGAYDIGPQRISWFSHMMTNWMGDEAFLRRLNVQVRIPNLLGDTQWIKGAVTGKDQVGDRFRISCDVWATNQLGERTAWGMSEVYLPSRAAGAVVLPVPIEPNRR